MRILAVLVSLRSCLVLPGCGTPALNASLSRCEREPLEPALVCFSTSDGGLIYADAYGTGPHGVVLAHGGRFDRHTWAPQARALARAGFRVLAIDFRGYGRSRGGSDTERDEGFPLDVLGAAGYLRDGGATTISVVGGSFGGWAAAEAAASEGPAVIDRVVLLAASPIEHPELMRGRKLFIVARDDPNADGSLRLTQIREQYERAPEPKELVVLNGSAHAQHIFTTAQGPRLMEEIRRFLSAP